MAFVKSFKPRIIKDKDIKNIEDEELEKLFIWIDEVPLSRQKRNITRDFSDGGKRTVIIRAPLDSIRPIQ